MSIQWLLVSFSVISLDFHVQSTKATLPWNEFSRQFISKESKINITEQPQEIVTNGNSVLKNDSGNVSIRLSEKNEDSNQNITITTLVIGADKEFITSKTNGKLAEYETSTMIQSQAITLGKGIVISGSSTANSNCAMAGKDSMDTDNSSSLLIMNTTGQTNSSILYQGNVFAVRKPFVVVDFRQWYKYGYEFILYGYFMPGWALFIWTLYAMMIIVFIKAGITSTTQMCIVAMAICDGFCPIFPCIMWMYVYTIKKHIYYLPYEWCRSFYYLTEVIPQIFASISTLLTVMMAIQRFIIVAFPFKVGKLVSTRRTIFGIFTCVFIGISTRLIYFFHYDIFSIPAPAFKNPNETMNVCAVQAPDWIGIPFFRYLGIVQVIQTILYFMIPFIILIISQLLLVITILRIKHRRQNLTVGNKNNEKRENLLTKLTIAIVGIQITNLGCSLFVLIVDLLYFLLNTQVIDQNDVRSIVAIINSLYWVIIVPSNFVITCCLSKEFRVGLRKLLCSFYNPREDSATIETQPNRFNEH